MIKEKRVLVVVPARGGSKGIPLKNLKPVCGIPLVARVGHLVRQLPMIDRAVVSTDNSEIAEVATESGLAAPFLRPARLSGDLVSDHEVLVHALAEMERQDQIHYDIIVMLQPTSPMRQPEHVVCTLQKLVDNKLDAVWTVSETDSRYHPLKQLTVEDDALRFYDPTGSKIIARQQLTRVYHRNGAAYALTRECLLEHGNLTGRRWSGVVIEEPLVSIDNPVDIEMVEWLLKKSY